MSMHEFHITTYVLTCDQYGATFVDGTERYAGDLIQQAKNNDWQVIVKSPTDSYYCPEHWQYSCRDCGRQETGDAWVLMQQEGWLDPEGPDGSCPNCQKKILEEEELP